MSIPQSFYPLFAPLPVPFAEELVKRQRGKKQELSEEEAWGQVYAELQRKRGVAFLYMNPFVSAYLHGGAKGSLYSFSRAWFLQTLSINSPDKKPVSDDNIEYWRGKGLLRFREHGIPDLPNAAAVFIYRMLVPDQRKGFLPSSMQPDEPDWWCWRQDEPDKEPIPCPVPLPEDLPASALLWTPWAGASWEPSWLRVGNNGGAIRFAGTLRSPGIASRADESAIHWQEALTHWEPKLACLLDELDEHTDPDRQEQLHDLATVALRRLARSRIVPTSFW